MASLAAFLDLRPEGARSQWRRIAGRTLPARGKRQEDFLPVEVVLCHALFWLLDPHRYGGANIATVPDEVKALAAAMRRTPGSLTNKMLNLDGSRPHGAKLEPVVFERFAAAPDAFVAAYDVALRGAREEGFGPELVPDVLAVAEGTGAMLVGQDEIGSQELDRLFGQNRDEIGTLERELAIPEGDAQRLVEQRVRLGQHRFAREVLRRFAHRCGFCGFAPAPLGRQRLLVASHVKPWRDCEGARERLDPANGIAACPTHDTAFDAGLLGVNGGLRIHLSPMLQAHLLVDRVAESYFGHPPLGARLVVPAGARGPGRRYLAWHREHCYKQA